MDISKFIPRCTYKDFVIPWPKDYPKERQEARKASKEWKAWLE